jgi:flagellar biosynthesis protein
MGRDSADNRQTVVLRYALKTDRLSGVFSKGRGHLAEKIIEVARQHNIPIREDKNLLQILSRLDLNQEIPPEVYRAVAEILAFVYRASNRRSER